MYAPVYVLALWGARALLTTRRDAALSVVLIVGLYVALIDLSADERPWLDRRLEPGGEIPDADRPAPRPVRLRRPAGRCRRPLAVAVVALQIAISAYAWQHPKILWNDGDGRAAFCEPLGEGRAHTCRRSPGR